MLMNFPRVYSPAWDDITGGGGGLLDLKVQLGPHSAKVPQIVVHPGFLD